MLLIHHSHLQVLESDRIFDQRVCADQEFDVASFQPFRNLFAVGRGSVPC